MSKEKIELAASIESDFLYKLDRPTQSQKPRLSLNVDDDDYYLKTILSRPNTDGRRTVAIKDSHRRLESAFRIAREQIRSILAGHAENNQFRSY